MPYKKSQIAIEYLAIIGFVIIMITVIASLTLLYSQQTQGEIAAQQIDRIAKKVVDSAESVYFLGAPTRKTITATFPDQIRNITIKNNEIEFIIQYGSQRSSIAYASTVPMNGSMQPTPGLKTIVIEAGSDKVTISSS